MARLVRTDNAARRQPYVWKGTKDLSFGNGVRLPVLLAGACMIPAGLVVAWVLASPIGVSTPGRVLLHALFAVVVGGGGAYLLLRAVASRVDSLRPFRWWRQALMNELTAPRAEKPTGRFVEVIRPDSLTFAEDRPEHVQTHSFDLPPIPSTTVASADHH